MRTVASAQHGHITGQVRTADGKAAEDVSIVLKLINRGTVSGKDGRYTIKNVPAATYTIVASLAGVKSEEKTVTVGRGEAVTVDFELRQTAKDLEQVVVSAYNNRYNEKMGSASLRVATPLLELPQNVQVVSRDMLKDQQVISMSDGLIRNVSGLVRSEHWGDMYTNITARGGQVQAFRNGFNVVNSYWGPLTEDMSFVDHIEFVKGPAGFMLSSGDPAGIYNVVTKKPTGQTKGEVSFTTGSWNLYRTTLDIDGKLSKDGRLLYRLNLSAQNKGSFRVNEYNDRYVIAPVISYQLDDRTKVTFEYNYQRANMSDVGSYYVFAPDGFAKLPRSFNSNPAGLPGTKMNDHSFYATLNHDINSQWKFTAQLSRFDYNQIGSSSWPSVVNTDYTMIRTIGIWDAKSAMTMGQAFVNGDLHTGAIRHRILAGLDGARKNYYADWMQYHDLDTEGAEFDMKNPNLGVPVNGYPQFDRSKPLEERAIAGGGVMDQNYSSVYVQDELGFLDNRIRLTVAGRYTSLSMSAWGAAPDKADHFTPRAGLSVSIDKNTSAYALYDQSFLPQAGTVRPGTKIKPITGNNMEIGVKREWAGGRWASSVAAYRIVKKNELVAGPVDPATHVAYSIDLGEKRAQGIEFDLRGTIVRGLNLVVNYAYTESKVTKINEGAETTLKVGDYLPTYSTHTANAWLSYRLSSGVLRGFGVNAGVTFLGDRHTFWEASPAGGAELPDYTKVDAGISYDRDKIRITANVFNLLDTYLYSGSWYSWLNAYYYQAEAPRNLRLSVAYTF
ncbi:MAG: TonB-dependent receptor [Flavihumibacter sp.]